MKKLYTDNLPTKTYRGKTYVDWIKSVGMSVDFIYDDICGKINIVDYTNKKVSITYNNLFYKITTTRLVDCSLGFLLKKYNKDFNYKINDRIVENKRDLVILDRNLNDKKRRIYKYKCNVCGWDNGVIEENNLKNKRGCSCCSGHTVVEGINDIPTTAPWMVKYFQGGYDEAKLYTKNSNKFINPICPDCGCIKNKAINVNAIHSHKSIGCKCSDGVSYSEKFLLCILDQLKLTYIYQLDKSNLMWCNKYRYDFYILMHNLIIETHGIQHYESSSITSRTLEEEQQNDILKEQLAKENDIKHYITLDCRKSELEWIKKSVLESELPTLFNFTEGDIDWIKCNECALKNLVKEICVYKNNNPDLFVSDIVKLFPVGKTTIRNYLKIGNYYGWCTYNPKEELSKSSSRFTAGKIEVFKNEISYGTYYSARELSKVCEDIFNVKFNESCITKVCKNVFKQHKGYVFKYI